MSYKSKFSIEAGLSVDGLNLANNLLLRRLCHGGICIACLVSSLFVTNALKRALELGKKEINKKKSFVQVHVM